MAEVWKNTRFGFKSLESESMKVAMVTSWDEPCGIADFSRALVAALQSYVEVKVVPLKHGQRNAAYFRALGQVCNECDLVHIQHEYVFFGGRDPWNYYWQDVLNPLRVPYLVTSHTWLRPFSGGPFWKCSMRMLRDSIYRISGWSHYLEAGQFKQAKRVLVHTKAHYQALIQRGIPAERLCLFPQGIPENVPTGDARKARDRWSLSGKVVTIFGFLIPSKGHLLALRAWEKAPSHTTLVIVGKPFSSVDETYAREVTRRAQKFSGSVRLTGYLNSQDLADVLAASNLLIMPYISSTSSYSLSILLAQAKPVLASDIECFREIVAERPCLALFKSNDADDLAVQLKRLLADEDRLKQLQQEAKLWVQEHTWDKIASRLVKVYTEILEAG